MRDANPSHRVGRPYGNRNSTEGNRMIRSRFSLLGVLVAAMGLMAFFASAAQAEGEWLVLEAGKLLTGAQIEEKKEEFTGALENETGALLSEIGTTKIDIVCTAGTLIDALLNATGGVKEGGKVRFTGCQFFSGGTTGLETLQKKCAPKTNGGAVGTVETKPAHALLKLHTLVGGEKDDTLLILPDNLTTQLVAELELGEGCAFGESLPIFGHLALQDCGGTTKALEHLKTHLATEFAPLTTLALFAQRGKAGAKNASVDGSANVSLVMSKTWAGSPK